ncbi:MAG: arginine--tRNA ligase [Alphaproteobacteria bacterium]|nr:arginine--tRNA ligase [Alphaproteobacteria bacterium]NDC55630.1 arginine--tRNA ligase [Alphaproteobacteria bacterium]NDG03736.1 arginine--tRNA ligase [Alphaproteobacteria bacterium]
MAALGEVAATAHFVVEAPRDPSHGDFATNVAMTLAKPLSMQPRQIAEKLLPELIKSDLVAEASVAGPGFINLRLHASVWQREILLILAMAEKYGDSPLGQKKKVNIEYVSANPTGPMHAGHVRGAVVGDVLAGLLHKAGYDVTREYYFNDAGAQVDVLGRTVFLRYRQALGEDIGDIPEGLYPGEYLIEVGQALATRDGPRWKEAPEAEWLPPFRDFAVQHLMKMIKHDLALIGIKHDVFTNERELIDNGTLEKAFHILEQKGLIYTGTLPPPKGKEMDDWEPVPLTLFRSSQFGDSTDRPLKKRDGHWAYIMPDIAYHSHKIARGFSWMINVLGKDHGGYLERMRPAVAALSDGKAELDVIFNSIVKVFRNGEPVKLSKRSGNIISLRDMVEEVGAGAIRFFMLSRTPDSELEFDFAKVIEQSKDNPVFYVQYAHARCCSVKRHAAEMFRGTDFSTVALARADVSSLQSQDDLDVVKLLAQWPRLVESAATACEPHRIVYYLIEVASAFHGLWNKGRDNAVLRFLHPDQESYTMARLALLEAVRMVIASGLQVIGTKPIEELRDDTQTL